MNIPVIALCDADSPLQYIDVAIPGNNKGPQSIALLFWLLAREVLYLRSDSFKRGQEWNIMVDLFMYREIAEKKKGAEEEEVDEAAVDEAEEGDAPLKGAAGAAEDEEDEDEEEGDDAWKPGAAAADADDL